MVSIWSKIIDITFFLTNFRGKIGKIGLLTFIDRPGNRHIDSGDNLATLFKNVVNFGPVELE